MDVLTELKGLYGLGAGLRRRWRWQQGALPLRVSRRRSPAASSPGPGREGPRPPREGPPGPGGSLGMAGGLCSAPPGPAVPWG